MKIPPRLLWSPSDVEPVEETGLKYNPHHDRQGRFAAGSGGGKGSLDDRIAKANSQYDLLSVQNEVPVGKATFLSDDGRFVVEGPEGHGLIHLDIAQLLGHKSVDDAVTDGNLTRIFVTDADRLLPMGVAIQARDLERVKFSARRVDHGLPKDRRDTTYYHWEANSKLHGYAHGEGYLKDVLSATGDVKSAKKFNWDSVTRKYNPNHSPANGRFTSRAGGSGLNVAGSDEEFAFLKDAQYRRIEDPATGATIDQDEGLVLLMENRGYFDKPTTLSHDEFEKADKLSLDMELGWDSASDRDSVSTQKVTSFYRGIQDDGWGVTVEKMSDSLVDGSSRFHGVGNYGNGLYFAAEQRIATRYAIGFQASEKGVGGMVQRVAIKPDAKFISESALTQEAFDLHRTMGVSFNNVKERGRLATWLGYDGIKATDRIVVLNHSKLIIDKSSLVRLPREKSLDLFDIELKFNPNHSSSSGRFVSGPAGDVGGSNGGKSDLDTRIERANRQVDVSEKFDVGKPTLLSDDGRFITYKDSPSALHDDIAQALGYRSADAAVAAGLVRMGAYRDSKGVIQVTLQANTPERIHRAAWRVSKQFGESATPYFNWELPGRWGEGFDARQAKSLRATLKFNPNHSPSNGRFTSGGGSLSAEELSALRDYQTENYRSINQYLRTGKNDHGENVDEHIALLDSAIDKAPLTTEDAWVFRNMSLPYDDPLVEATRTKTLDSWVDKGFVSTSRSSDAAERFGGDIVMSIFVPKGSKALEMPDFHGDGEKELLLPRGSTFKIDTSRTRLRYSEDEGVSGTMVVSLSGKTVKAVLKFNPNHDRRGRFAASSGGRDLLGDDPSTVSEEWARSLLDQREYGLNIDEMSADDERISRSGGDVILSRIVDEQWGGAGTVKVADLGNANDANLLFRGVEGSTDYHTGFINGDRFMGKGVYGNGIYFAQGGEFNVPGSALFQDNVGNAWYKAEGYGSNVRKYRISSSAKIVDWEALTAEHTAWLNKTEQGPVRSLTKDPGRYAALKGYDGIKSPPKKGVSQYVIFNRRVLEAHVDRQPDFSFNKSATFKYNPNHDQRGRFASGSFSERLSSANPDLVEALDGVVVGEAVFMSPDGKSFVRSKVRGLHMDIAEELGYLNNYHVGSVDAAVEAGLTRIFVTATDPLLSTNAAIYTKDKQRVRQAAFAINKALPEDKRGGARYHWETTTPYASGEGYITETLRVKGVKSLTFKYNPYHDQRGRFTTGIARGPYGDALAGSIDPHKKYPFDVRYPPTSDDPAPGGRYEYHSTTASGLQRIAQEGLDPAKSQSGVTSVTPHLEGARFYGKIIENREQAWLLRVTRDNKIAKIKIPDGFDLDESREHWLTSKVEPKDISVYLDGHWEWVNSIKKKHLDLFETKYNPNHDARGRFSHGGGGGGIDYLANGADSDLLSLLGDVDPNPPRDYRKEESNPFAEHVYSTLGYMSPIEEADRSKFAERARKHNPYHDERGRFASARGYFSGGPVNNPAPLTKAETGRIGEEIAMRYLGDTASTLNVGRNNYPIDLVSHDRVVEVKTGLSTNPKASQQWRATIGQPGKKESEWLKTATAEEKRAWNNQKRQAILERKQRAVDEVSKKLGRPLKPTTLGVIIDPHTREAHVYEFEGFHLRIGWSDKGVKEAYRASYKL